MSESPTPIESQPKTRKALSPTDSPWTFTIVAGLIASALYGLLDNFLFHNAVFWHIALTFAVFGAIFLAFAIVASAGPLPRMIGFGIFGYLLGARIGAGIASVYFPSHPNGFFTVPQHTHHLSATGHLFVIASGLVGAVITARQGYKSF